MSMSNTSITVGAKEFASCCIRECSLRHGFDAEEEIRILGLESIMTQKSEKAVKEPKTKVVKEKKAKTFPLPFIKNCVDMSGCQGLSYNRGLFTQCDGKRMENGEFCNTCQSEADKNASGSPDCGNIRDRMAAELYDFKDPNGRSPIRYMKLLNKLKLNETDAMTEAGKLNIVLDYEHFVVEDKNTERQAKWDEKEAKRAEKEAEKEAKRLEKAAAKKGSKTVSNSNAKEDDCDLD